MRLYTCKNCPVTSKCLAYVVESKTPCCFGDDDNLCSHSGCETARECKAYREAGYAVIIEEESLFLEDL